MTDTPQWITDYAQECRVLFGLERWDITVVVVTAPDNNLDNSGFATVNTRYLDARIELRETLNDANMRHTIMHEMLHVAFAPMAQAQFRVAELIPKKLRNHARALYEDGVEQTIEGMTRALQSAIKPSGDTNAASTTADTPA